MTGPREPTPREAEMLRQAAEARDRKQLRSLVIDLYPNVLWGSVTRKLSDEDRRWVFDNLNPEPEETPSGYWGA